MVQFLPSVSFHQMRHTHSYTNDANNLSKLLTFLLTCLLTLWSRVLFEKLTGFQLVKKFPAFYGTRMFITAVTRAHHLSLSWAISIQSIPPHLTSWWSILILSSQLRLGFPSGPLSFRFPHQNPVYASPLPHTRYMPRPFSFFSILSPEQYWASVTDRIINTTLLSVPALYADTAPCPHVSVTLSEESIHDQLKPQTSPVVKPAT